MIPISAVDCISPAFARARRVLTLRRSWATAIKLGFLALFAEAGSQVSLNFPGRNLSDQPHPHLPPAIAAFIVAFAVVLGVVVVLVSLLFVYLGSRLQLVLFDLILRQDTTVAPSWRLFGRVTWRWIGIRLLLTLCVVLLFLPMFIPAFLSFRRFVGEAGVQPSFHLFFTFLLGFIAVIFLFIFVLAIVLTVIRDFGMPAIIFENTGVVGTLRRAIEPFRIDPGQTLLYLLLRFLLGLAGGLGADVALLIAGLVSAIPPGLIALVLYFVTRNEGAAGKVILVAGLVVLGVLFAAWMFVLAVIALGAVQIFLISYSIYFLAGRYPPLGAVLESQEPQLAYPRAQYAGHPPPPVMPPPMIPPPPAA